MKKYYFALEVPDDFNPEELDIDFKYKDDITVSREGFIDEDLLSKLNIKKDTVGENDVVRFTFPVDDTINYETLDLFREMLEYAYKCPVVGHADNLELFVENADKAIDMFNGMIAKIKVRAAVKSTTGIILPN